MSEEYDPMWTETENDAANTKCEKCGEAYQVVRPGKIQQSCDCAYLEGLNDQLAALTAERDQLKLERDVWMGRVDREQKITEEFRAERDETRKELAEWHTKTLDVENHPVVVALRAERDKARESESDARGLADCAMKSAEIHISELARMKAALEKIRDEKDTYQHPTGQRLILF